MAEAQYDGSIPKDFLIQPGRIGFDELEVEAAYREGIIDVHNKAFLLNTKREFVINPEVAQAVTLYRSRILRGKPGRKLFVRMQELGLKHHPELGASGLDITGYTIPEIDLGGGILGGYLRMKFARILGDVNLKSTTIKGDIEGGSSKVGGSIFLGGAKIRTAHFPSAEIEGSIHQYDTSLQNAADYRGIRIGGDLIQSRSSMSNLLLEGATIGSNLEQMGTTVRSIVSWSGLKIGGQHKVDGLNIGGIDMSGKTAEEITALLKG